MIEIIKYINQVHIRIIYKVNFDLPNDEISDPRESEFD